MESSPSTYKASPPYCPASPPFHFPPTTNSEPAKFPPLNGVSVATSPPVFTGFGMVQYRNTLQQPSTSPGFPNFGSNSSSSAASRVRYPIGDSGNGLLHSPAQPSITYLASSDSDSSPWPNERRPNDRRSGSTLALGPLPVRHNSSSNSPHLPVLGAFGPAQSFSPSTSVRSSHANGHTSPPVQSSSVPTQSVQKERNESWESVEPPVRVRPQGDLLSPPRGVSGKQVMNSDDGDWECTHTVDVDVDDCSDDDDDDDLSEIGVTDKIDPNLELREATRRLNSTACGINGCKPHNVFLDSGRKLSDNPSNAQTAAITASLASETNRKNGSESKRNRDESPEIDDESLEKEKEDVDANSPPASKRTKSSIQKKPRCEYHFTRPRQSASNLPIVHAVISTRRYRRNGTQRYRLEKLFLDQTAAMKYAEEWTLGKFSKYEDDAERNDLDVIGDEEIGYYTPNDWNESSGMNFGAFVQRRFLE